MKNFLATRPKFLWGITCFPCKTTDFHTNFPRKLANSQRVNRMLPSLLRPNCIYPPVASPANESRSIYTHACYRHLKNGHAHISANNSIVLLVTEADYTLDDSFWNEETPVGKCLASTRTNAKKVSSMSQLVFPIARYFSFAKEH